MLTRPSSCNGCPLNSLATGFMAPTLAEQPVGVALVGEALGEDEADQGAPFKGKAGFRLTRLIQWAGFRRENFDIWNTIWCRPPSNKLHGEWYEKPALAHCARHWTPLLARPNRVLVPMGNVASGVFIGREGILTTRGYVYPGPGQLHVIPTVHPSFIQRGQSRWSAAFINDLQKAVELASGGLPAEPVSYLLDPSPSVAYRWAQEYRRVLSNNGGGVRLAFDIETPGKKEDEDDLDTEVGFGDDLPDQTWHIHRIGFSYRGYEALSIPWEPPFIPTIKLLLSSEGEKVVWNAGFDVPRVRRAGVPISGVIHDGMVAWHVLHSDLPKRLGFVATFCCPWQPAWKHLSGSKPAFYNATDADVELRCMDAIERDLRRAGLWEVYERDVVQLEPILEHMHRVGMPVDAGVRLDRAKRLDERIRAVRKLMESSVPLEARRIDHVFVNTPKDTTGLLQRPGTRPSVRCAICGARRPRKDHFKTYVKKSNPCAGGSTEEFTEAVTEYYRLADFTPSREQLIRYHQHLKRPLPMVFDKKAGKRRVSFGERQLKDLTGKYQDDKLYSSILDYRSLDKIAGTYIGRLIEEAPSKTHQS